MAIRVVRKGVPPGDRPMCGVCVNCNSLIECLQRDAQAQNERNETMYRVTCPECGNPVFLSHTKPTLVPPRLLTRSQGDGTYYRLRDGGPEVFWHDKAGVTYDEIVRDLQKLKRQRERDGYGT